MDYADKALPWSLSETQFVDWLGRMTQLFKVVLYLNMWV